MGSPIQRTVSFPSEQWSQHKRQWQIIDVWSTLLRYELFRVPARTLLCHSQRHTQILFTKRKRRNETRKCGRATKGSAHTGRLKTLQQLFQIMWITTFLFIAFLRYPFSLCVSVFFLLFVYSILSLYTFLSSPSLFLYTRPLSPDFRYENSGQGTTTIIVTVHGPLDKIITRTHTQKGGNFSLTFQQQNYSTKFGYVYVY